jgi:hypothetical protein
MGSFVSPLYLSAGILCMHARLLHCFCCPVFSDLCIEEQYMVVTVLEEADLPILCTQKQKVSTLAWICLGVSFVCMLEAPVAGSPSVLFPVSRQQLAAGGFSCWLLCVPDAAADALGEMYHALCAVWFFMTF